MSLNAVWKVESVDGSSTRNRDGLVTGLQVSPAQGVAPHRCLTVCHRKKLRPFIETRHQFNVLYTLESTQLDPSEGNRINTDSQVALETDAQRYEALLRISEALSACREPEELSRVLDDQLRDLITFDLLDVKVFKENSDEIEWRMVSELQIAYADLPIEETASWHVYHTQEALHIADGNVDTRFPRLKQLLENNGIKVGSVIRVPLTTAHRRLGTLGILSQARNAYTPKDVSFLQFVARGVALAIDDILNLRQSHAARLELERHNARLKLLLDLTNRITSNLDLSEVLRAISASVRQIMLCDATGVSFPDPESGMLQLYVLDFPDTEGSAPQNSVC